MTKTWHCTCYGPKGANWPTYGADIQTETAKEAKKIATSMALNCGWPSIRKVEVREAVALDLGSLS